MINIRSALALAFASVLLTLASSAIAQPAQMLKRTASKTERFDFGAGGTVSIIGAPNGSVKVVGSSKNEIEITAVTEVSAPSEADLDTVAAVTTYVLQESLGRAAIISSGTHNKLGDKKLWKKFPKGLLGLPFRIDYTISVPRYCDLQVDNGKGDVTIAGVEGAIRLNAIESNAKIDLIGGGVNVTIGSGTLDLTMPDRSWRGNAIDAQLVNGTLTAHLPASLSAEFDAVVLRSGRIENAFTTFKPRSRTAPFTDRSIAATVGSGGVSIKFTVGEGTLRLVPIAKQH